VQQPPPDEQRTISVDATPPADGEGQTFAAPPPDVAVPVAGTGIVRGRVTLGTGTPFRTRVHLYDRQGGSHVVISDASGRYEFRNVIPGSYSVSAEGPGSGNPRPPDERRTITVSTDAVATADFDFAPLEEPVDRGPCCKPYGAPPARRRVV
jgi:hypothetical protein